MPDMAGLAKEVGRPSDDEAGVRGDGARNVDDREWPPLVEGEAPAKVTGVEDWPTMGVMGEASDEGMWWALGVVGRKRMPSRVRIESLLGSSWDAPLPSSPPTTSSSSTPTRVDDEETFGHASPSLLAPGSFRDGIESLDAAEDGDEGE